MVSDKQCEQEAIAWCKLMDGSLSFLLTEETEVSLGIIVNLEGQASFGISAFKLEGTAYEYVESVNFTDIEPMQKPAQPTYGAIYNLWGQRIQELQKGINIVDGKKILK